MTHDLCTAEVDGLEMALENMSLKPCACCGFMGNPDTEDEHPDDFRGYAVKTWHLVSCGDCGARTGRFATPEEAADAWNRRAPLTVADAMTVPEVRALVESLDEHGDCNCEQCQAKAPFLAAMKKKK